MSTQIQFSTFDFHSNAVRVITDPNQEPWFCGTDVCDILGYKNAPDALAKHCKQAGIAKRYISHPSGRKEAIFINEPNLYRLIIKSRKPEAERFEAWVFEEVLPQIRKTGKYQKSQQPALPEPERRYSISMRKSQLHDIVWLLYSHRRMNELLGELEEPLRKIGSNFAPSVYSCHVEYKRHFDESLPLVRQLIAPLKDTDYREWQQLISKLNDF